MLSRESNEMNGLRADHCYILLALAADILIKKRGVVFHYHGHAGLKRMAGEIAGMGRGFLLDSLFALEERIKREIKDTPPLFRRTYLISQTRSLRGLLAFSDKQLTGIDLLEGVAAVLGMVPPLPYDIKELRNEERSVLTRYRYDNYAEFQAEMEEKGMSPAADDDINRLINELRDISARVILPLLFLGDELEVLLKSSRVILAGDKKGYPPCYYVYKGKGVAEVSLSHEHRRSRLTALRTLMHEVYPGHHLYYLYREALSNVKIMGDEAAIDLVYSAETPMSEGVAEVMPCHLEQFDEETQKGLKITTAREHFCKKILYNVWYYRFVNQNMSEKAALSYLCECGFDGEESKGWLRFIDEWRLYYPSYPVGTEAIKRYLTDGNGEMAYLYLPKTFSVLQRLQQPRRVGYEESSSQTVLHGSYEVGAS